MDTVAADLAALHRLDHPLLLRSTESICQLALSLLVCVTAAGAGRRDHGHLRVIGRLENFLERERDESKVLLFTAFT